MKLEITRDIVSDLWPLYESGEATADSRALVEAYLHEDDAFASLLKEGEKMSTAMPQLRLSPDAERRLLDEARARARTRLLLVAGALAVGGLLMVAALGGALYLVLSRA